VGADSPGRWAQADFTQTHTHTSASVLVAKEPCVRTGLRSRVVRTPEPQGPGGRVQRVSTRRGRLFKLVGSCLGRGADAGGLVVYTIHSLVFRYAVVYGSVLMRYMHTHTHTHTHSSKGWRRGARCEVRDAECQARRVSVTRRIGTTTTNALGCGHWPIAKRRLVGDCGWGCGRGRVDGDSGSVLTVSHVWDAILRCIILPCHV
jgi:hypothetical protein